MMKLSSEVKRKRRRKANLLCKCLYFFFATRQLSDSRGNFADSFGEDFLGLRELGIADGRSPVSIAGGAIYFTCYLLDKPKTIREISTVAGVSEGTIKLVYKLYYADKEKLVKDEWIKEGRAKLERLPVESGSK